MLERPSMQPRAYRRYLLAVLAVTLAFNNTDRFALGLVAQNIKVDLHLSDTELGFLSGIAFALFYSVMGIPIARWADQGNRVTIIGVTTALWSAAVALCGVAGSFLQLLLIRVIVGVGEAGCLPPAHSLIADYFAREERPRAVSFYLQGITASLVIGYFITGWLNQFYGWRAMFVMIGLPGLALAALSWLSLEEPRQHELMTATSFRVQPSLKEVFATLWATATFRHLLYAFSVNFFFAYGVLQWTPAFFVRSFGLQTGELGTWFVVVYGLAGILGTYWGGAWAARYAAKNECLQLKGLAFVTLVSAVLSTFVYLPSLAPNYLAALGWLGLANIAGFMTNGPMFAVLQTLVPGRMRAMSIAFVYFVGNLIGLGFGPWAAGALSDALRPWAGEESLRYALLMLCPGFLWVAWHFWAASKTVTNDVAASHTGLENNTANEDIALDAAT
jgi:predicted MFS family arabinose efflux permease